MKAHRKEKIHASEFNRIKEIRFNYHKFLWTKFKRVLKTKRLHKK